MTVAVARVAVVREAVMAVAKEVAVRGAVREAGGWRW